MPDFKVMVIYLIITIIAIVNGQNYRAGVVLYRPIESQEETPDEQLPRNVDNAITIMKSHKGQVDIFVLPEYALTMIKAETETKAELKSYSINNIGDVGSMVCTINGGKPEDTLVKLACAAKNNYYIVANLIEEQDNNYYSTDVAFDTNGVMCLKCRKQHIINGTNFEKASNQTCNFTATFDNNQRAVFTVLFGTDLVYGLSEPLKTDNVIMTSSTKNNLPLNMSVSLNQGFAINNGINLIVAEYNNVNLNYGGSGIFYSNGTSVIAFNSSNVPNANDLGGVLIREVPIKPNLTSIVNVESTIFGPIPKMNMEYIDMPSINETKLEGNRCIGKRCCKFKAEFTADSIHPYKWVVMNNKTNILGQETDIFFCGLVAPSANFNAMKFKNISISIDDQQPLVTVIPVTLNQNFLPTNFQFNKGARSITLNQENNVMLFGIMEILGPNLPSTGGNTGLIVIVVLLILVLVGLLIAFLVWRKRQTKNRRSF